MEARWRGSRLCTGVRDTSTYLSAGEVAPFSALTLKQHRLTYVVRADCSSSDGRDGPWQLAPGGDQRTPRARVAHPDAAPAITTCCGRGGVLPGVVKPAARDGEPHVHLRVVFRTPSLSKLRSTGDGGVAQKMAVVARDISQLAGNVAG